MTSKNLARNFLLATSLSGALFTSAAEWSPFMGNQNIRPETDNPIFDLLVQSTVYKQLSQAQKLEKEQCRIATNPDLDKKLRSIADDFMSRSGKTRISVPLQVNVTEAAGEVTIDVDAAIEIVKKNYELVKPFCYSRYWT